MTPNEEWRLTCCCSVCICMLNTLLVAMNEVGVSTLSSTNTSATSNVDSMSEYATRHNKLNVWMKKVIGDGK